MAYRTGNDFTKFNARDIAKEAVDEALARSWGVKIGEVRGLRM